MHIRQVLVIGYVWPEPKSSAAGSHMLSILQCFLAQGWQVTFASPAHIGEHKVNLQELGIKEQSIALNCSSFDSFVRELQPDMVMFDRFMLEEQFGWRVAEQCPNALRVLDTEDLHCLRDARHQASKYSELPVTTLPAQALNSDIAKREIAAIFRCDLTLIISDYEYQLLQDHFSVPTSLLHILPFMLRPDADNLQAASFEQRQHFISIGNFRHAPNWDAIRWLKQAIWPLIRSKLPDAELHIYGAYPPPKATQLHNAKQGFYVKGWADSSTQVMSQSRVCLAPLRFGAGIKGKLAEAMLCGTPNVTTSIGIEGMQLPGDNPQDWPGFIADTPEAFADKAADLYQNQQAWNQCQSRAAQLLNSKYNGAELAAKLIDALVSTKAKLTLHRERNFIGAMLQHHQLKSTQYMAQWIEAKNRKL